MTEKGTKRIVADPLYFFCMAGGLAFGCVIAAFFGKELSKASFAGGFAHGVPGALSLRDVALAFFLQAVPMLLLYYAAYGHLLRPTAAAVLAFRSIMGGCCIAASVRLFLSDDALSAVLVLLFVLFELLTLSLHLSFAYLAGHFFLSVKGQGIRKSAVGQFTGDFLFFYGLILFFYIVRGCITALLNS